MQQMTLPLKSTLREQWEKFHAENPHVYRLFERFALEAQRAGAKQIGAALVWERMRWYTSFEVRGEETYRLNNSYRAFYARHFMAQHPELGEFFETREQPSEVAL